VRAAPRTEAFFVGLAPIAAPQTIEAVAELKRRRYDEICFQKGNNSSPIARGGKLSLSEWVANDPPEPRRLLR
jgi:hypothetical protein